LKKRFIFLVLLWVLLSSFQPAPVSWPGISLKTIDDSNFNWEETRSSKVLVFVFLLADCPACQGYSKTLKELNAKYSPDKFFFCGIFPGNYSKKEEMKQYRERYKIPFPLLADPEMKLAKKLNAHVSPEVFVTRPNGAIEYQGRIDDLYYNAGKRKPMILHHDLQDALENIRMNKPVLVPRTQAIGCIIQD